MTRQSICFWHDLAFFLFCKFPIKLKKKIDLEERTMSATRDEDEKTIADLVEKYINENDVNKFKILRAHSEPKLRYSIFKIFTLFVMCSQFKITEEYFFSFFMIIGLSSSSCIRESLFQILYKYFPREVQDTINFKYKGNRPNILTFVKYRFIVWNTLFLIQFDELHPTIMKKEQNILLKFWIVNTLHTV